jgi:hypothetical protein
MSAPSSPSSEYSTLSTEFMPDMFVPDPKVIKMLVAIIIARHGILHYHGEMRELAMFQW